MSSGSGRGGYRCYGDAVLSAPDMTGPIAGTTPHPSAPSVWGLHATADGSNQNWAYFNETADLGACITNPAAPMMLVVEAAITRSGCDCRHLSLHTSDVRERVRLRSYTAHFHGLGMGRHARRGHDPNR